MLDLRKKIANLDNLIIADSKIGNEELEILKNSYIDKIKREFGILNLGKINSQLLLCEFGLIGFHRILFLFEGLIGNSLDIWS